MPFALQEVVSELMAKSFRVYGISGNIDISEVVW